MARVTDTQEGAMVERFKGNTLIYNRGKKDNRDVDKDALWASQGHVIGFSDEFTTFPLVIVVSSFY